jgi:hypothetical protein
MDTKLNEPRPYWKRVEVLLLLAVALFAEVAAVHAGTDATAITTEATSAFADIATLCVAIGTFFVVYRLVKKIR